MAHESSVVACPPAAIVEAQKLKYFPRGRVPSECHAAEPLPMHLWYPENEGGVEPQEGVPLNIVASADASSSDDDICLWAMKTKTCCLHLERRTHTHAMQACSQIQERSLAHATFVLESAS